MIGMTAQRGRRLSPTTYCPLNAAVPILRLYFEEEHDLRPSLRLSRQTITSLISVVKSDFDHGWETDIENLQAVIGILRRVVSFPTLDDLEAVGEGFAQLAGSPAFRIKPSSSDAPCYFNRKLFHSVQLQAITDHKGKFLDIFVGYPGSVHDARVLKNSPVYTGHLYPPAGKCILGDGGYP
ncbi:hypothetical protein QQF64_018388 [Cirrhinus molitorella]|uniref:DDE Tnp4 domain-containing protein n=1 Tax=Cirrhinus molitorella TaxID=172907 RepID=A0ABR3LCF9_9TELE